MLTRKQSPGSLLGEAWTQCQMLCTTMSPLDQTASATQARTKMVQKVLDGLSEEAFELAGDIGVDVLTQPGGVRKFVNKLRDVVFPRATEKARELFKTGQNPGSPACQNTEFTLSYVSKRRRWWKLLNKTLDKSIEFASRTRVSALRPNTSGDHSHQGMRA